MYSILFISLPLGKRSGFWLNSISGSRRNIKNRLPGSLGYSLFCKKRLVREAVCHLRAHKGWPSLLSGLDFWGGDQSSKKAGQVLGTGQHLLTLHSNYSALQVLSSTYANEVPTRAITGHVLYLRAKQTGAEMDCTHVVPFSHREDLCA